MCDYRLSMTLTREFRFDAVCLLQIKKSLNIKKNIDILYLCVYIFL